MGEDYGRESISYERCYVCGSSETVKSNSGCMVMKNCSSCGTCLKIYQYDNTLELNKISVYFNSIGKPEIVDNYIKSLNEAKKKDV